MDKAKHWESVYSTKAPDSVSWFQAHAAKSVELIRQTGLPPSASIIDVGGGASVLVDDLLSAGYSDLTVLDLSNAAMAASKARLGAAASKVSWVQGDITKIELQENAFDLWHDRAVFHFLNAVEERAAYVRNVMRAVKPGGHVIVATFAEDGPEKCSGLPVSRYSAETLHAQFGEAFQLLRHDREVHRTPFGSSQEFIYCHCRRTAN